MIHNHEVRSSILRPATRKQHHRILCDVFSYARAPARQVRSQYTMRACSQWDTDEYGMPQGIGIQKTSANSPPAFLGNRHLRSKHGFIRRCEASTGASCDPLLLKLIENQALAEKSQMLFSCLCRSDPDKGENLVGDHAF